MNKVTVDVRELATGKILLEELKKEYLEYHNHDIDDLMEYKPLNIEIVDIQNL